MFHLRHNEVGISESKKAYDDATKNLLRIRERTPETLRMSRQIRDYQGTQAFVEHIRWVIRHNY